MPESEGLPFDGIRPSMEDDNEDNLKNKEDLHIVGMHTALDIFCFAVFFSLIYLDSKIPYPAHTSNTFLQDLIKTEECLQNYLIVPTEIHVKIFVHMTLPHRIILLRLQYQRMF